MRTWNREKGRARNADEFDVNLKLTRRKDTAVSRQLPGLRGSASPPLNFPLRKYDEILLFKEEMGDFYVEIFVIYSSIEFLIVRRSRDYRWTAYKCVSLRSDMIRKISVFLIDKV